MIKLMAILIGLFLFIRPVFPADETNRTPPVTHASAIAQGAMADKSPEATPRRAPGRAGGNEVAADSGVRLRDPFWPIGFFPASMSGGAFDSAKAVRPKEGKETAVQASNLSEMLRIGGVVRKGDKFYATINGFTVQTGEVITVVADGEVYKLVVERIDFNKVRFKPVK